MCGWNELLVYQGCQEKQVSLMCITWDLLLDLIVLVVGCQGGAGGMLLVSLSICTVLIKFD
jgi:hypothetical protein